MKTAKPIIFSTPMVQAILEDRKTQTRRVIKPQPEKSFDRWTWVKHHISFNTLDVSIFSEHAPYRPGDILWVRETWNQWWDLDGNDQPIDGTGKYYYAAGSDHPPYTDFVADNGEHRDYPIWRPSIHMPKAAARLFLQVLDVRPERLQDISEDDRIAEGEHEECPHRHIIYGGEYPHYGPVGMCYSDGHCSAPAQFCMMEGGEFQWIWDSINTKRGFGWDTNPWVWAIKFKRYEKPVIFEEV